MAAALYIDSAKYPLATRSPNLMPFHIGYSGPAPISTYFRVKPGPPPTYGAVLPNSNTESASQVVENRVEDSQDSQVTVTEEAAASGSSSALPTLGSSSSSLTLVNEVETTTQELSQISLQRHYVAAFRGRGMHGQQIDLPKGYSGLVFHSPDANRANSRESAPSTKGKGRATDSVRSSRSRTKKVAVEDIDVDPAEEEDIEMCDGDEDVQVRILRPTGTFSSFTLWNPDIPVDEGRDEYIRSLTEWINLSAEIHHYED